MKFYSAKQVFNHYVCRVSGHRYTFCWSTKHRAPRHICELCGDCMEENNS